MDEENESSGTLFSSSHKEEEEEDYMESVVSTRHGTKIRPHHHHHQHQRPNSVNATQVLVSCSRAVFARALFIVHSLVTIRQTVLIAERESVWGFALLSLLIVFEGGYAIIMRAGDERKWFCSSVFLYIVATAPPIWLLETRICAWRNDNNGGTTTSADIGELRLQLLEQLLLVNLIVGRWLLPKGDISREQLSQILLAYLAISSDIVEFFDVFKEKVVYSNTRVQTIVLTAWTLSLFQFPFVLTVSRARKMRVAITNDYEQFFAQHRPRSCFKAFYDVDIWAIVLANVLQDVPFLLTRLYLMTVHNLVTYTMIFFFFKNMLIILLQTYRSLIIINDRYINPKPPDVDIIEHNMDLIKSPSPDDRHHHHGRKNGGDHHNNHHKKKNDAKKNHHHNNHHKQPNQHQRRSSSITPTKKRRASRNRSISEEREQLFPRRGRRLDTLEES